MRAIAARLDRATSTVSREVERNGGRQDYRATKADEKAWEGARRPKRCLLARNDPLRDVVARKLEGGLVARADLRLARKTLS